MPRLYIGGVYAKASAMFDIEFARIDIPGLWSGFTLAHNMRLRILLVLPFPRCYAAAK